MLKKVLLLSNVLWVCGSAYLPVDAVLSLQVDAALVLGLQVEALIVLAVVALVDA